MNRKYQHIFSFDTNGIYRAQTCLYIIIVPGTIIIILNRFRAGAATLSMSPLKLGAVTLKRNNFWRLGIAEKGCVQSVSSVSVFYLGGSDCQVFYGEVSYSWRRLRRERPTIVQVKSGERTQCAITSGIYISNRAVTPSVMCDVTPPNPQNC